MGDILVLNYEESDQRRVEAFLSQTSYNTITVSNTLQALKFLRQKEFNLIIVCLGPAFDWNMVSTLRSASKKVPILAIIPGKPEINPRQLLQSGVWKILMSPFEEEELANILQKLPHSINS